MKFEDFDRYGRALYGDRYGALLARTLGVHVRTMRRWQTGKYMIPDLTLELKELARRRLAEMIEAGLLEIRQDGTVRKV